MKRVLALLATSLLATQSFGASWTNGNQKIGNVIWIPGYHGFYATSGTFHDPENCGGTNNRLYLFDPSLAETTVNKLYAMLLTASASDKKMWVYVNGCVGSAPMILGLQMDN